MPKNSESSLEYSLLSFSSIALWVYTVHSPLFSLIFYSIIDYTVRIRREIDRVPRGWEARNILLVCLASFDSLPCPPPPLPPCIKVPWLDFPFTFALENRVVVNSSQQHGISWQELHASPHIEHFPILSYPFISIYGYVLSIYGYVG